MTALELLALFGIDVIASQATDDEREAAALAAVVLADMLERQAVAS